MMLLDLLHVTLDGYKSKFTKESALVLAAVLEGSSAVAECDAGVHGQTYGAGQGQVCLGS